MSIHLNVTGDTADEFLAQFTALAHALGGVSTGAVAAKLVEAPQAAAEGEPTKPVRSRTVKPKDAPVVTETAGGEPSPTEETTSATVKPEPENTPPSTGASDAKPLVFDTDVAPKVVEYVQLLGRDAVAGVLSQFGVQKASQLSDPAQWRELLDALADAKA